jgi:hypothetical protein
MDLKTILALLVCLTMNTTMAIVEKELDEFRAALRVYQAATKTPRFRDSDDVKHALAKQIEFQREKLGPNGEILDPWGRSYVFTKSIDGSLVIISLGNPEILPTAPYVLVVQSPE